MSWIKLRAQAGQEAIAASCISQCPLMAHSLPSVISSHSQGALASRCSFFSECKMHRLNDKHMKDLKDR